MPMTATSNYVREQSDKYASPVDSDAYMSKSAKGPVGVKSKDGKVYTDPTGGINYDLGIIERNHAMGDKRSGKIVVEQKGSGAREGYSNDGLTKMASGLERVNTTEQHLNFLEAQSKFSKKKEYTWDVDLAAAEGASVDAGIEKERQCLAKESRERKAAEARRIREANKARATALEKDAVHGKYAVIVDDDIMDEEAGRERLRLAYESKKKREEDAERQRQTAVYERSRIRNTKSKIHSWNDGWNAQIDQRHDEEAKLADLLADLREAVADDSAPVRADARSIEKRIAAAQNWVVSPPTAKSVLKGPTSPTSPTSVASLHWQLFGGKQLEATVGNLYD